MRLGAVPVFMAFVHLSGCSDASGPAATRVDVILSSATGPFIEQPSPTQSKITCRVSFTAEASGGGTATWLFSWLMFYGGLDRSVPVDSVQISQNDTRLGWGAAEIESGQQQVSHWVVSASAPFGIEIRFQYKVSDGTIKEARASHTCGPNVSTGTGPPTIQATLQPSSGEIQAGDTLTLTYSASSLTGLWETRVVVSGACSFELRKLENFPTTVAGSIKLPVPAGCRLGEVLRVDFIAFDIALRGTVAKLPASLMVVDRTPPRITTWFGLTGLQVLSGYYFSGDTIPAFLQASDNQALSGVYRETSPWGRIDSVRSSAPNLYQRVDIPIPEGWVGRIQVRAFSRDGVGLVSDTLVTPPDSLRIYPTVSRRSQSRAMAGHIREVVFDSRRPVLYTLNDEPPYIGVLSTADLSVVDSIALPAGATDFDLTASGDTLVLTFGSLRALGIVDLSASARSVSIRTLTTLNVALDQRPEWVRTAANGKCFVRLNGATFNQTTLLEVDLASGAERLRTDAGNQGLVGYVTLERSDDHSTVLLFSGNTLQRYDAAQDAFGALRGVSTYANRVRVNASGSRLALGLDLYDGALQFERKVESPAWDPFLPVAFSPDGRSFYHYSTPQGILLNDATDGRLINRTRAGAHSLRVSLDGSQLAIVRWREIELMDLH